MVTKHTALFAIALLAIAVVLFILQNPKAHHANQSAVPIADVAVDKTDLTPALNLEANDIVDDVDPTRSLNTKFRVNVSGRVIDGLSRSVSGMHIEISSKNTAAGQQPIHTATTDPNGEFVIRGIVPDNQYRLEVLASGAYAGFVLDSLQVKNNMDSVTITLDSIELISVDGMIVNVYNSPVPDFEILVRNTGMAYPGVNIVSDSSGFFQLNEFPAGDLQLSTTGDDHFKINGISLQPDEYQNLTLMLDKGSYHLSGWVSDDLGAPISQARVVITALMTHEGIESYSYRFRLTDKNGEFEFSELGGQEHKLVIDATGYESRTWNYQFQSFSDNLRIELKRL